MLFGEKSPELPQHEVEAYFEAWRGQVTNNTLAVVAPHPTDSNFVLRGRTLGSLNNEGTRIKQDITEAAAHHQILTELGLSIPVYEHAVCFKMPLYRSMLFTAVERVIPQPLSKDEEHRAKNEYRDIIRSYYEHVQDERLPYFLSDVTYPFQTMYGTGTLDIEKAAKLQLLDVEPRIHKLQYNDQYPELFLSGQKRYIDNVNDERWQNFSFAKPRFDEQGAFIAQQ